MAQQNAYTVSFYPSARLAKERPWAKTKITWTRFYTGQGVAVDHAAAKAAIRKDYPKAVKITFAAASPAFAGILSGGEGMVESHVVSDEDGHVLAVYDAGLLSQAQEFARRTNAQAGERVTFLHHIVGSRPRVGVSISMKNVHRMK